MKLYRVERHGEFGFSRTYWTTELEAAKQDYEKEKEDWYDDEVYEDDTIQLVEIEVPEEVFEEFEDDSTTLQEEVMCIDPDDEEQDGYVSSYWHTKIEMKAGKNDEL
ncbi:hypothetical protein A5819_003703 [Enterococcus sp. 7E2_DIV0204]|uniref:hypothetical protein n=1 Tax=unclassified Enterococcus TaxID=2608891 RepID=UPI000A32CB57|nr:MULTISPECIES: hypothetical protein [unclassified Enterococcus]OTN83884.1 hypothetical protein A5819_003703 [Enterococcus sp. 7E2_DIV0204]OTP47553.1 hypothetical protein A5884_003524 [Enterococcus sp. 7D2_DIV0200]